MIGLFFRSLAGRLALVLVAALLMAQVAAIAVFWADTSRVRRAAVRTQEADRIATLARVIAAVPAAAREDIIRAFATPRHRYWAGATSLVAREDMGEQERQVADNIRRMMRNSARDPRIGLVERNVEDGLGASARVLPNALEVSVQLTDGTWLNGETALWLPKAPFVNMLRYMTVASVLSIVLVVLLAARWITRPLSALADAADRLGRGEAVELSLLSGPSEVVRTLNAFNIMQQRLSRFLADRLTMVAAISHDLRTPITAARLRAEMIEDAEVREAIVRSLTDMQHITEATLSFARDETLSEEPRTIDLNSLLEAVADDLTAVGCDVSVAADGHLPYRCRPALLRRALTNLMSNAAKYGNCARVALELTGEHARITIDDEGPGLPSDQLQKVFEPFVRLDPSRSNETGGIGLGLSIARSVVRAHGGEVTLMNMSCGLRAQVVLPRCVPDPWKGS
ncbi:ATP-binding protein [Bradyrhizobium sp.]|uniref:ATP-binding protein n=1 Tax=Bradyrhizobium sp. TaxID=376 RepID=UPI0025BA0648|nr:ATP-binding protein [Bradyrhizobium sp.]MBV8916975.1 HAMP domain-containing protein [Bradyrhizobium sp.]